MQSTSNAVAVCIPENKMAANLKVTAATLLLLLAMCVAHVELAPLSGSLQPYGAYSHARSNLYFAHDSYGKAGGYVKADGYAKGYGSACDRGQAYGPTYSKGVGGSDGYGNGDLYDANPDEHDLYGYNSYAKDVYPTQGSYGKGLGSGYGAGYDKSYASAKYSDQAYGAYGNGYYPIRYGYRAGNYVDNGNGYVLYGQF